NARAIGGAIIVIDSLKWSLHKRFDQGFAAIVVSMNPERGHKRDHEGYQHDLGSRFHVTPSIVFACARHSTHAMIRVQRSPQQQSRAMNPAFFAAQRPASSRTPRYRIYHSPHFGNFIELPERVITEYTEHYCSKYGSKREAICQGG